MTIKPAQRRACNEKRFEWIPSPNGSRMTACKAMPSPFADHDHIRASSIQGEHRDRLVDAFSVCCIGSQIGNINASCL